MPVDHRDADTSGRPGPADALPIGKLGRAKPLAEYLKAQGRFAHMTPEEVAELQKEIDVRWKRLLALEAIGQVAK